jgi:DNA-binding PadR family transcriptional regulator
MHRIGRGCGSFGSHETFGPRRNRRGRLRNQILLLLADGPKHGYEIIQTIAERTQGLWQPSPGAVYPNLQLLEDQGLVESHWESGKRIFSITDAGRAAAQNVADETRTKPEDDNRNLGRELMSLQLAVRQLALTGDPDKAQTARDILERARNDLLRLITNGSN